MMAGCTLRTAMTVLSLQMCVNVHFHHKIEEKRQVNALLDVKNASMRKTMLLLNLSPSRFIVFPSILFVTLIRYFTQFHTSLVSFYSVPATNKTRDGILRNKTVQFYFFFSPYFFLLSFFLSHRFFFFWKVRKAIKQGTI